MPNENDTTCRVRFEPSGLGTDVPVGTTLLDAAQRAGLYLTSLCGGDGVCGKCKVVVSAGNVDAPPSALLCEEEVRSGTVLACQARVRSDVTVALPRSHTLDTSRIVVHAEAHGSESASAEGGYPLNPLVRRLHLALAAPTMQDQLADHERLGLAVRDQVDARCLQTGLGLLQQLPARLQASDYDVTALVAQRGPVAEVLDVEPGDTSASHYAIVVDLGTTTVVGHLVDLTTATTLDAEAAYNSQMHFGDDYIRRIMYAEEHDAFGEMQRRAVADINGLIEALAGRHAIDPARIALVVCAGNTAMIHFLLGLDARRIRRSPYVPAAAHVPPVRAADLGLRIHENGLLYCLPAVGAYVGADIVAGVLATKLHEAHALNLFIDIGTNGEVVLAGDEWMMGASSSAGPAFEGSGIRHGMRAGPGAIERVAAAGAGQLAWRTVGDEPPRGLCGSGLLDALAAMLQAGVIDRTGRFANPDDTRIAEGPDGLEFTIVAAEANRNAIVMTQADVANLIRSKAGVYAAVEILMRMTGTDANALEAVYVAGGFGRHLDVASAVTIGLLPDLPAERIHFVGNTSVAGAKMAAMSCRAFAQANEIADRMTYVDLMNHPDYMDAFMQANFLPHTDIARFPSVPERLAAARAGNP